MFSFLIFQFLIPVIQIALFCLCIGRKLHLLRSACSKDVFSGDPQHIPMALHNSEAINGFPTGNLSLTLLNKISPNHIHFVSRKDCKFDFLTRFFRRRTMILIKQ